MEREETTRYGIPSLAPQVVRFTVRDCGRDIDECTRTSIGTSFPSASVFD